MGKGSSQQTSTTTQTDPTQVAQQPYLDKLYSSAQNLYQNQPTSYYPNQTLAQSGTAQQGAGYDQQLNAASWLQNNFLPGINSAYSNLATGGYGGANSPAYGGYQQYAQGGSYPQTQFQDLGQTAYTSAGNLYRDIGAYAPMANSYGYKAAQNDNLGLGQLGQTASGYYLNSNPYIDKAIQAAQDPVTRNYQTAIAPGMDATLSAGGRYGSGAMAGMYDTSQRNLARGLGDISTNMMNANYERERQLQNQAAGQYGQLYNQGLGLGITGAQAGAGILNNAAGQYWTGLGQANQNAQNYQAGQMAGLSGLQGGYQAGAGTQLDALRSAPQFAGMQFLGPQQYVQGGQGLQGIQQQQIDDLIKRWNETQQDPWKNLSLYQQAIGPPAGDSATKSTPYYTNRTADTLGTLFGVAKTAATILPMFSDRRLKEDDEVVGAVGDLPLHTFRYKGDPVKRVGFMADEVERLDPGAVLDTDSGYKAVDYGRAFGSALNSFMRK